MIVVSSPYCDKITATLEEQEFHRLGSHYNDLAESIGGRTDVLADGYRSIRLKDNEQILVQVQHKLARVTLNGRACATLRLLGLFGEALSIIGESPHRVTQIHAKVDVNGDDLTEKLSAYSEQALALGLCSVPNTSCRSLIEVRPDGKQARNTYVGKSTAEMQRVVYDKRLERHFRGYRKFDDSVDEISVELRVQKGVTRKGLCLNDAYDVSPLFWHYMGDCPLVGSHKPSDVKPWVSVGSGFDTARRMRSKLDKVMDYERFGDFLGYFKLAHEVGYLPELLKTMTTHARRVSEGVKQNG